MLKQYQILEIATTGQIALGRGPKTVKGDLLAEQEVPKGENHESE